MDLIDDFALSDFPVMRAGGNVPMTQANLQVIAERLVAAASKINELVNANEALTARVIDLESRTITP